MPNIIGGASLDRNDTARMTGLVMRHLLKWMNNAEKQINLSVEPLFSYMKLRQTLPNVVSGIMYETLIGLTEGEYPQEMRILTEYIEKGVKSYMDNNYPPKLFALKFDYDLNREKQKKVNTIMNNGTPFSVTLENMQLLLANAFAMPSVLNEIVEEVDLLFKAYGHSDVANSIKDAQLRGIGGETIQDNMSELSENVVRNLTQHFSNMLNQILQNCLPLLANARWGLKTINTYHFLKHSHKIKLSSAVQKMFEMTDISDDIEISKRLQLPYPMNYIEFNEALEFSEKGREYQITGALMYEIETRVQGDGLNQPLYKWSIDNFPNAGRKIEGTVCALIGVDQMYQFVNHNDDDENEYKYQIDKAYFTHVILGGDKVKFIDGILDDDYQTWAAGVELNEIPTYENPTLFGLTSHGYRALLQEGLYSILNGRNTEIAGSEWKIDSDLVMNCAAKSVTDPFYAENEMGVENPPTNQKYVVIELIINQDTQNEDDHALFANIGPYIEIGRRDDGDKWGTVKDGFVAPMTNIDSAPAKMLEAFKIAMQSIWFINEPDVRLKERDDLLPSRKRIYFPKRKVTKRRKIVLRGEINRYIKTLQQTIRSSPTGAYWVRGHWRNQWYPSIQDHKRKWIMPYVKGTGKAYKKQVDLDPKDEV